MFFLPPIMENQMEKIVSNDGESNGKDNGK